jgi:hypothetical protein
LDALQELQNVPPGPLQLCLKFHGSCVVPWRISVETILRLFTGTCPPMGGYYILELDDNAHPAHHHLETGILINIFT